MKMQRDIKTRGYKRSQIIKKINNLINMSKGKDLRQEEKSNSKKIQKKQKKDKIKPSKEIDMLKFKQKISNEMANVPILKISNCMISHKNLISNNSVEIYSEHYKKYISEEFNTMCIVFINRLISESQTLPLDVKNSNNVHKILLKNVKELMMNEYEITLFSLLLDDIGWLNDSFSFEEHLFFCGLSIKKMTLKEDVKIFINYFSQINKGFIEQFEKWELAQKDKLSLNERKYKYNQVYLRFSMLKKPYNIYCKTNYIDYNSVVDKILRMSLPYSENKQKEDEDTSDENSKLNDVNEYNKSPPTVNKTNFIQNNTIVNINNNKKIVKTGPIVTKSTNQANIFGVNHVNSNNPTLYNPQKSVQEKNDLNTNSGIFNNTSNKFTEANNFLQKKHLFNNQLAPENNNQNKKAKKHINNLSTKMTSQINNNNNKTISNNNITNNALNNLQTPSFSSLPPQNTPSQNIGMQSTYYPNFSIFSNGQHQSSQDCNIFI